MLDKIAIRFRAGAIAAAMFCAGAAPVAAGEPNVPRYTADGQLIAPTGYESWVFVGSNLGLAYRRELRTRTEPQASPPPEGADQRPQTQQFHNVYINPEAYAYFVATGEFPDPTILVMDRYSAADKEPKGVVSNGVFNGEPRGVEVAVKNLSRPDGGTTAWAYYDFTDRSEPGKSRAAAPAFPDVMCENCHRAHASRDNVWVQFYPVLRRSAK